MLRLAGDTEPSKTFHLDSFGFPVTEQVASQQEQHVALLQIIHASLCSDALPTTPGVNGTRVEAPFFRLAPRQGAQVASPLVSQEQKSPPLGPFTCSRGALIIVSCVDASGYYVVALRKIMPPDSCQPLICR